MHQVFTGKRCHSCRVGKIERQRSIRSTWRFTSFLTSWTKLKLPKFVWWKLFWFCWSCFFLILIKPVRNSTCGVVKTWYNYDLNILFLCSDWIHTESFPGRMRPVKSFPSEQDSHFLPPQCIWYSPVDPRKNLKTLLFPGMSFNEIWYYPVNIN